MIPVFNVQNLTLYAYLNFQRLQHTCKTKEKCTKYKDDSVVGSPIQEEPSILMECSAEDNMNDGSLNNVQMLLKHSWNTIHTLW